MNQIKIFNHEQFGEIRTMLRDNEPWFVGKDVAMVLGYSNATKAIIMHVDEDDNVKVMMEAQSQNGTLVKTKTTIINESGLYSLILSSNFILSFYCYAFGEVAWLIYVEAFGYGYVVA